MSTSRRQGEIFGEGTVLCRAAEPIDYSKMADQVRADVATILDELRAATTMPWDDHKLRLWKTIMPQTTRWLPDDERERVCAEFDGHIARLTAVPASG